MTTTQLALELHTDDTIDTDTCPTCRANTSGTATVPILNATLVIRDGEFQVLCVGCEEPITTDDMIVAHGLPVTAVSPDSDVFELVARELNSE